MEHIYLTQSSMYAPIQTYHEHTTASGDVFVCLCVCVCVCVCDLWECVCVTSSLLSPRSFSPRSLN